MTGGHADTICITYIYYDEYFIFGCCCHRGIYYARYSGRGGKKIRCKEGKRGQNAVKTHLFGLKTLRPDISGRWEGMILMHNSHPCVLRVNWSRAHCFLDLSGVPATIFVYG